MSNNNLMTTTAEVEPALQVFYDRVLLKVPTPKYIYGNKHVQTTNLARNSGNAVKWRRYNRLSAATTVVSEGITPSGQRLSKVDINATVSQYLDYVTLTDVVDLTNQDPVITETVRLQNDQMMNTDDQLARDYINSSASTTTASNGSGPVTLLNETDIMGVHSTLRADNIDYVTQMITAGQGQGTAPVRASYLAKADTVLEDDLEDVTGFKHVTNYSFQRNVDAAEYGSTGPMRWLTSTQGYTSGANYYCPVIGKVAGQWPVGKVNLSAGNAKSIIKAFGSAGTSDPGNQRATVAWKMMQAYRILQELAVHILIVTNGS